MGKTTWRIEDHSDEFLKALEEQVEAGLTAIGIEAENAAKEIITEKGAVDTGRLRASITYAIAGEKAARETYQDDNGKTYDVDGKAPKRNGEAGVLIGTNVDYGKYVELGTTKMKERPFLKPAITQNAERFKELMKIALEK